MLGLKIRAVVWICVIVAGLLVLGACALLLAVAGATQTTPRAQAGEVTCVLPVAGGDGPVELTPEQQHIVGRIVGIGRERAVPPRAWQIAIQAGKTESNLANLGHGDRDSLGIFQMRPSMGWGSPAQLQDVDYQIHRFYDALGDVPNWQQLRPGDAAQRVERSAFPDRYHEHEPLAMAVLEQAGVRGQELTGCSPASTGSSGQVATKALEYARAQTGAPYVWGAEGPDAFDCSGLVMAAYQHAGVSVPRTSVEQFRSGQHVPLPEAQPGDLVFWANETGVPQPEAIHHVALYVGDGRVLQAPQDGETVKESDIWRDGLMPVAVRPTGEDQNA